MSSSSRWAVAVVVFLLVGAGIAFWVLRKPGGPPQAGGGEALRDRRDRCLADLENGDLVAALPLLEKLSGELPNDTFGPRNRAVGIAWGARTKLPPYREPSQQEDALRAGVVAFEEWRQRAGESAAMKRLAARLAAETGDEASALADFGRAAELDPKDAGILYEWHQIARISFDASVKDGAPALLERAYEIEPGNLALMSDVLILQAERREPAIAKTIDAAVALVKPFNDGIRLRTRYDLVQALEEMKSALAKEDWTTVLVRARGVTNLLRPEVAIQLDRRRLVPHELELAQFEFSEATQKAHPSAAPPMPPEISVALVGGDPAGIPDVPEGIALNLADFDLDGRLDVIVLSKARVAVFSRGTEGNAWKEIAAADVPAGARFLVTADLDRDYREQLPSGAEAPKPKDPETIVAPDVKARAANPDECLNSDVDLMIGGADGVTILRNRFDAASKSRTFEAVPQDPEFAALREAIAAAAADVDHDGDLDLILSTEAGLSIWANRDNFTFMDISARSSLPPKELRPTTLIPVDWNRNVDIDVLAAGPNGPTGLLENNLHGRFRWTPFEGSEWAGFANAASAAVVDGDANASWDIVASTAEGIETALMQSVVSGVNRPLKRLPSIAAKGEAARLATWDYNNDGVQDLVAWNATSLRVLKGQADGSFSEADILKTPVKEITALDVGDLDGDGDEDLVLLGSDRLDWLRNDGGNANRWVEVRLSAEGEAQRPSERTNMHGIGSLLEMKAGGRYQARTVSRQSTHFGLGQAERPEVIRILWTNGIPHNLIDPDANRTLCAPQHLAGSCPYIYTWTGSKYEFFSDCLWGAPIGLQFGEGVLAPSRSWEYILIPGSRLAPKDGEYRLQVTEELWEATYIDTVRLIAVDHPADVAVYSNEKVGPPDLTKFKVHTVRDPRTPVSIRDAQGRDVLKPLRADDDDYVRPYGPRLKQGLAGMHHLEIDFGELSPGASAAGPESPGPRVTLFLSGWVFPASTSLNVGMSQNPSIDPPRPPFLQIPDDNGGWREAMPSIGFPGGKTKTIAVDLPPEVFASGNTRVRVCTSMELAWDRIFFTVDEPPSELRQTELELRHADLHFRGYSRRSYPTAYGPDWYDYSDVTTEPLWPPMGGQFTRYGEVTELLHAQDDLQVVFGGGDEITVRFSAEAPALPDGWTRDFLLYNVGWDKDADLNTVYGQTAEPLPFVEMQRYPYGAERDFPDTPKHRDFLRVYQTRTQNEPAFWRHVLRH